MEKDLFSANDGLMGNYTNTSICKRNGAKQITHVSEAQDTRDSLYWKKKKKKDDAQSPRREVFLYGK